jgi:hypothetical protein
MSYKLLNEDEKSYTVQHPDGSSFKVAKKGISKALDSKIKGFWFGGDTSEDKEDAADYQDMQDASTTPDYGQASDVTPTAPINPVGNIIPSTTKTSTATPSYVNGFANSPEAAAVAFGALDTQKKAQGDIANLSKQQYTQEATNEESFRNQKIADEYLHQTAMQDVNKQRDSLMAEIGDGKIDTNRFHDNLSTPQRITNGIALLLGGLGGVGTGGKNLVAERLDKMVDQDIQAQKDNLNNKNNLLNQVYRKIGNMEQAEQMTKLITLETYQSKAREIASKYNSQKTNANLALLNSNVDMQKAQIMGNIAASKVQQGKALTDKTVNLPNGQKVIAPNAKVAEELRTKATGLSELGNQIDQAKALAKDVGLLGGWSKENREKAELLNKAMAMSIANAKGMRKNSSSYDWVEKNLIPNMGGIAWHGVQDKVEELDRLHRSLSGPLNAQIRTYAPAQATQAGANAPVPKSHVNSTKK